MPSSYTAELVAHQEYEVALWNDTPFESVEGLTTLIRNGPMSYFGIRGELKIVHSDGSSELAGGFVQTIADSEQALEVAIRFDDGSILVIDSEFYLEGQFYEPGSALRPITPENEGGRKPETIHAPVPLTVPTEIAGLISRWIEPLEREWHAKSDALPGSATTARIEASFQIIRVELRTADPDAQTLLRQLQILLANEPTAELPPDLATARVKLLEIGIPSTPTQISAAADNLDSAFTADPALVKEAQGSEVAKAFRKSYGTALGKYSAAATTALLLAAVTEAAGANLTARAIAIGRWLLEVLRQSSITS